MLSIGLGALALMLRRSIAERDAEKAAADEAESQLALPAPNANEQVTKSLGLDVLELEIGYGLIPLVDESEGGELLRRVSLVRRQMATELGLVLQPIRIRDNVALGSHEYGIKLKGVEIARSQLAAGCLLAMNPGDADPNMSGEQTTEPAFGLPALWIAALQRDEAEAAGYTVVDQPSVVITHLTETIRANAADLLGRQDTRVLLDHVKERHPALVDELVPDVVSVGDVHRVLQGLLAEGVSIRDLVTILETLGDRGRLIKDASLLVEYCRQALARQLTNALVDPLGRLAVITVDPSLEAELGDAVMQTPDGSYLGLEPGRAEGVVRAVRDECERVAVSGFKPVVVCSPKVRRHLRALCAHAVPRLVVLSYNEIVPTVQVETVGSVTLVVEGSVA